MERTAATLERLNKTLAVLAPPYGEERDTARRKFCKTSVSAAGFGASLAVERARTAFAGLGIRFRIQEFVGLFGWLLGQWLNTLHGTPLTALPTPQKKTHAVGNKKGSHADFFGVEGWQRCLT